MKFTKEIVASVAFIFLSIMFVSQNLGIKRLKETIKEDNINKKRQMQMLASVIDLKSKRSQFIRIARDSVIKKHNKSLTDEEAFDIAEFNFYVCQKYKLDPILLLAIQRQESRFNSKADGPKNSEGLSAIGLNQIWPLTGRMLCDAKGIEYYRKLLYDPKVNTELAAKYLDYLRAEYSVLDYILIGYNAGPAWIGRYQKTKRLPNETKNYILAVKKYYSEFNKHLAFCLPEDIGKFKKG